MSPGSIKRRFRKGTRAHEQVITQRGAEIARAMQRANVANGRWQPKEGRAS